MRDTICLTDLADFASANQSRDFIFLPPFNSGGVTAEAPEVVQAMQVHLARYASPLLTCIPENANAKKDRNASGVVEHNHKDLLTSWVTL